jgi:ketosteroid isomerase-like protein
MTKVAAMQRIENEVRQAAFDHLNARDAATALSDFTEDAVLVSNARWYSSAEWAEQIEQFYGTLQDVHIAEWEEMRIDVVRADAAVVTAKFRWSSTDTSGARIDLQGVWTALYVLQNEKWKIRVRHESFEPAETDG